MKRKYVKLPVTIEAEQYIAGIMIDGVIIDDDDQAYINTMEGRLHVSPGDYIITGIKGERYPCKPDIFLATYRLADHDEL